MKTLLFALLFSMNFLAQATSIGAAYPEYARENCIEGFVVFRFIVSKSGGARNITITESQPKGIFEKAALTNLSKMHFEKEVGTVIENHKLTFKLENLKTCEAELSEPKT